MKFVRAFERWLPSLQIAIVRDNEAAYIPPTIPLRVSIISVYAYEFAYQ